MLMTSGTDKPQWEFCDLELLMDLLRKLETQKPELFKTHVRPPLPPQPAPTAPATRTITYSPPPTAPAPSTAQPTASRTENIARRKGHEAQSALETTQIAVDMGRIGNASCAICFIHGRTNSNRHDTMSCTNTARPEDLPFVDWSKTHVPGRNIGVCWQCYLPRFGQQFHVENDKRVRCKYLRVIPSYVCELYHSTPLRDAWYKSVDPSATSSISPDDMLAMVFKAKSVRGFIEVDSIVSWASSRQM